MKQLLLLLFVSALISANGYSQKLAPNVSAGIITRSNSTSFGGQISILSNPKKQGQFGAGVGFYALPNDAGPIIPLFVHFKAKLSKKNLAPIIDGNVGWHLYSDEMLKGGAFANLGIGVSANNNKRVKPFGLVKFQLLQFRVFDSEDRFIESVANGYLNLTIGVEF